VSKQQIDHSMTAEKWIQSYKASLKAGRVFTHEKASRLSDMAAFEFDNKHSTVLPDRTSVRLMQRIIVRDTGEETPREGKQLYSIVITAGVNIFPKYEQVFQRVVDTISFH
jgi:hypothetical protein